MAGHNFSRYMFSLWSTLFAPFNFLLTRIWLVFTRATEEKRIQTRNSSSSIHTPKPEPTITPAPTPTTAAPNTEPPVALASTSVPKATILAPSPTIATADSLPAPSILPPTPSDQNPSYLIADGGLPDYIATNSQANEDDLDPQQQPIGMAKKRNARGRGGAKSSIQTPRTATPVGPVTPVIPITPIIPLTNSVDGRPASASQLENDASGDTESSLSHPNGPKSTSSGQGGNGSQECDRNVPMSQPQPVNNQKENIVPSKNNDSAAWTVNPDSQLATPLPVADSTSEPYKSDTHRHRTADSTNTTSVTSNMRDGSSVSPSDAEKLHVLADRLTLDNAPAPQEPCQNTLNEATIAAETSALPVPLVVAVPFPGQLNANKQEVEGPPPPTLPGLIEPKTEEERAEREYHLGFMREALEMGVLALKTNETPVGCVLVYQGRVTARGMNATNVTRNGTRHAEFMALSALLSRREPGDVMIAKSNPELDDASWGDVDPKDGHIYPYGQKLHPAPVVDRSIISECVLYVTVEPCVMCASLLRQLGIKKVYFGAVNDKFGGTGGVFRVHMNSKPVNVPKDRPYQQGYGPHDINLISKGRAVALPRDDDDGDGGNVEAGYPVEGGYLRDDAVALLRRFYVQENGRAPQPRKKEGRAARLFAAMGVTNGTLGTSDLSDNSPETPVEGEAPIDLGVKPDAATTLVYV